MQPQLKEVQIQYEKWQRVILEFKNEKAESFPDFYAHRRCVEQGHRLDQKLPRMPMELQYQRTDMPPPAVPYILNPKEIDVLLMVYLVITFGDNHERIEMYMKVSQ